MASSKRNWLFGITATVLLILILELLLRVAVNLSVDYLSRRENINHEYKLWQMHLFDSFLGMNEPDPNLFWRLKANYRSEFISVDSLGFAGPEVGEKRPGEFRILFLGDSTPLGIGLDSAEESFVRQIEALLRTRLPDRSISIINASVAGYTSWQCRKQLELIGNRIQPDMVVTYFGNNDPSINGYLSDQKLYAQTRSYGEVNRLLAHSYIYQFLKGLVLNAKSKAAAHMPLVARVSVDDARENLKAINRWCDSTGCALMVCTVATPDLWPPGIQFKVFSGGMDSQGRLVMADELQGTLLDQWSICLDTTLLPGQTDQWTAHVYESTFRDGRSPTESAAECRRLLERTPSSARLWNNLGVALWQLGEDADSMFAQAMELDSSSAIAAYNAGIAVLHHNPAEAEALLKRAKELDNYSLRIKSAYNELYRRFCQDNALPLADIEQLFAGLPEIEYFVDHCHPTLAGHELIAGELVELVVKHIR